MCITTNYTYASSERKEKETKNISAMKPLLDIFRFSVGLALSINFVIYWAFPIMFQGLLWKIGLKNIFMPLYNALDQNESVRKFAANYIYSKPRYADFFAISLITIFTSVCSFGTVITWQLYHGELPFWLVLSYYFSWVGFGGRIMGASYALAHKEGHNHGLYKAWLRDNFGGHFFENILGPIFGSVPWNFTTSHIFIHHRLDGGIGDTFYLWDLDRSSMRDFMFYLSRVLLHTSGYSSVQYFSTSSGGLSKATKLKQGIMIYWLIALGLLLITRSFTFLILIYLQPFFCMTFFLALINVGFHGFLEFDENGKHIPEVDSTAIINGDDDYFGEDDHMAHHYNTATYYRDLPALQASKVEIFKKTKASVFQKLSIFELSVLILLGQWDRLADHYVDYSGKMTKSEIIHLLRRRTKIIDKRPYYESLTKNTLSSPSVSPVSSSTTLSDTTEDFLMMK